MPRGIAMSEIMRMVKADCQVDVDSTISPGGDDILRRLISNTQKWLAATHSFADLQIERSATMSAGETHYDWPTTGGKQDFDLTRPISMECYWGGYWNPLRLGITLADKNSIDPDAGAMNDPVRAWQKYRASATSLQYEVWPAPASATTLKLNGQMVLPRFYEDTDKAELDDLLIAQWTAAKLLARMKSSDAQAMLSEAQRTLASLVSGDNSPSQVFSMGGRVPRARLPGRPTIAIVDS